MMNLRIAVCDDDEQAIQLIEAQIIEVFKDYKEQAEVTITTFSIGEELIKMCKETSFDIIFLDIEMPKTNGYLLALEIGIISLQSYLVFVSGYENCVYDCFNFNPKSFIRKSCLEKDMQRTLDKYMSDMARKRISYRVSDGFGTEEVFLIDIYYIECNIHNVRIKTIAKDYHLYGSLKQMEEELHQYDFLKVHRNYLVNKRYIESVGSRQIDLKDGSKIEMSRGRKREILEEMKKYDRKMERTFGCVY